MGITVYDLLDGCLNDYDIFAIFDLNSGVDIAKGTKDEIMDEYWDYEVCSFDWFENVLTVNIDMED